MNCGIHVNLSYNIFLSNKSCFRTFLCWRNYHVSEYVMSWLILFPMKIPPLGSSSPIRVLHRSRSLEFSRLLLVPCGTSDPASQKVFQQCVRSMVGCSLHTFTPLCYSLSTTSKPHLLGICTAQKYPWHKKERL